MSDDKNERTIRAGDTVKFKCGIGPIMVAESGEHACAVWCLWFDRDIRMQRAEIPAYLLAHAEVDGRKPKYE